jgi:hypothetical protein
MNDELPGESANQAGEDASTGKNWVSQNATPNFNYYIYLLKINKNGKQILSDP